KLIQLLRDADRPEGGAGELSFGLLAHLIEETGYVQVWGMVSLEKETLAVSSDDTLELFEPLYAGHRFADFLEGFGSDRPAAKNAHAKLAERLKVWEPELEYTAISLISSAWSVAPDLKPLLSLITERIDPVFRDLVVAREGARDRDQLARIARQLADVCPHAPVSIAAQIDSDWEKAEPHAAEWEKTYGDDPAVLEALSNRF